MQAQPQPQSQTLGPTLLSYRAPDNCPEVAEFQKSVQRRSARVRFVDEGSYQRELSVTLSKEGELTIVSEAGTLKPRARTVAWDDRLILPRQQSMFARLRHR